MELWYETYNTNTDYSDYATGELYFIENISRETYIKRNI